MPMYNLIQYSDNCQDSSATLYQYKRDEPPDNLLLMIQNYTFQLLLCQKKIIKILLRTTK